MTELRVQGLTKSFGDVDVLRGVDMTVPTGELTAILGPSGCGKTTLLRLVAGFDRPDAGTIDIGGRIACDRACWLPPERRGVGYVAQEGALFPHLDVARNITFGLARSQRRTRHRVAELLELVGMPASYADRYPHQLSGGQQQRVALARALAPRPAVVLLDEPFTALDAGLREQTRTAVVLALTQSQTTAVLVTHDQSEALSVSSTVAIMREGRLVQTAAPEQLYTTPADAGVARFVGDAVLLPCTVHAGAAECALGPVGVRAVAGDTTCRDGPARLMLRPEQIVIHHVGSGVGVGALVTSCTYYGHDATVTLQVADHDAVVTARCVGHDAPSRGDRVTLTVNGAALVYST